MKTQNLTKRYDQCKSFADIQIDAPTNKQARNCMPLIHPPQKNKQIQVQGEIISQPGGLYISKLRLAKLQYMINACANFQLN